MNTGIFKGVFCITCFDKTFEKLKNKVLFYGLMILLLNCEFKGLKEKGHCLVDVITERNTGMSDLSRSSFNCPNMDLMKQNYDNDSLKQIKMWVRELVEG